MKFENVLISILLVSSFFIFWYASDNSSSKETVLIERAVDGDTLETAEGDKIRLLGINTPESGMYFYQEAKDFTKLLTENKTVILQSSEIDKYGRELGYVFVDNELLNNKIVENGFAHLYYYWEDEFYDEIASAEKNARENELGVWKHSKNYGCIKLVEFFYLDLTEKDKEKLSLKNDCNFGLNVTIKDDATHIYKEKIPANGIFEKETQNIWNDDGDSIYIWDSDGLVFFYRYP